MFSQRKLRAIGIVLAVIGLFDATARAADGTWINTAGGNWSVPGNWAGGTVADGAGGLANTAGFNTLDLTADAAVVVDTVRTNGNLVFADTDTNTPANWILSGSPLYLSGPKPTITVSNLGPANRVTISSLLVGTNGFAPSGLTVNGDSRVDLTVANIFTNVLLDHAILGLNVAQSPGVNLTNNIITMTNGGTILITANTTWNQTLVVKGSNAFTRLPGVVGGGNWNGKFVGDGTLYVNLAGVQMTFGGNNPWNSNLFAGFTGTILLDGGGNFRFDENNGATTTFGSRFATWDLGQTNNSLNERGASGIAQHTTFLGALKGGAATTMACNGATGVTNTFQIGDANLDTTYFGRINNGQPTAVTKSGTGTLTLAGTNAYTGITTVLNGRLALASTGYINNSPVVKVVSPGIFDVSAFGLWTNSVSQVSFQGNGAITGAVALANCTIAPGIAVNDTATITFASSVYLSNAVTRFDTAAPSAVDRIFVDGDLNLDATNIVLLIPTLGNVIVTNGTYILFEWTGSLNGDWSNSLVLSYPSQLGTLALTTNASKQIVLTVSGAQLVDLTWRGDVSGEWSTDANWRDTNNAATTWAEGRVAHFDDTGIIKSLNLSAVVSPARVLVDSSADYTFGTAGSGKITGAGLLIKNGSGKLILTLNNDYTGTTSISSNSTLQVGTGGTAGSVGSGPLFNDGTFISSRADPVVYSSPITGSGSLVQNGPGQVIMLGNHSYTGLTIVTNNATLQIGDGVVNGTIQGMAVLSNNATLFYFNDGNNATVLNSLSGIGNVIYQFSSQVRTFLYGPNVTNTGFTGSILVKSFGRLEVASAAASPNGPIVVENQASYYTHAGAFTNTQSITIIGQGPGAGVDTPRGFGALRLNNGWAGPVILSGNATVGGSSGTGTILGNISDGGNNFTLEYFGGTIQVGPSSGTNSYGITRITEGLTGAAPGTPNNTVVVALNPNAFSASPIEMVGLSTLRLNGNNIIAANLSDLSTSLAVSNFASVVQNASAAAPATLTVGTDGNSSTFNGLFADGGAQPLGLTKTGAGIFTMTGDSTSTGPVTVDAGTLALAESFSVYPNGLPVIGSGSFSNAAVINIAAGATLDVFGRTDQTLNLNNGQTLKGNGTLSGNLNAKAGSIVNPGASIGTLNVANNATFAGTLLLEVNRTNTPSNCDHINVSGAFNAGGILTVSNIGAVLVVNDKFQLFPSAKSGFTWVPFTYDTVNAVQYTWQNDVAVDGSVTVASVAPIPAPTLNFTQSGNSLTFSWTGPFKLQAQTNSLDIGLRNNWSDYPGGGTSPLIVPITRTNPAVFFRLSLQ